MQISKEGLFQGNFAKIVKTIYDNRTSITTFFLIAKLVNLKAHNPLISI